MKARELYEQGKREYAAGNYEKALALFERARQVPGLPNRRVPELLVNIGLVNKRLGRFATAITYFEQCIAHPNSDDALTEVAKLALVDVRQGADVPSPKFEAGDIVKTTDNVRIRAGPGLDQSIEATTPIGVQGNILEGPVTVDGYVWWKIEYHAGYVGWSAQPWLEVVNGGMWG